MIIQLTYFRKNFVVQKKRDYIYPKTDFEFWEAWRNLHFWARNHFPQNSDSYSLEILKK